MKRLLNKALKPILSAAFAVALAAHAAGAVHGTLEGPVGNAGDQFRFIWGVSEKVSTNLANKGFNMVKDGTCLSWDVVGGTAKGNTDSWAASLRRKLDRHAGLGIGFALQISYGWDSASMIVASFTADPGFAIFFK